MGASSSKQLQGRYETWARRLLRKLSVKGLSPRIESAPDLRDRHGPVHAGAFLREHRIAFNCTQAEFPRIFVHELFHFVWLRAGNPVRHSYEELLRHEFAVRARGELGWSAEWRKRALTAGDIEGRTRRWREYCCESFCDTAAWRYSGTAEHDEFTLSRRQRNFRQRWFAETIETKRMSL